MRNSQDLDRSGDLSDGSEEVEHQIASGSSSKAENSMTLASSPPGIPKLNLTDVGNSRPQLPQNGEKHWRVYVQLIEARDIPVDSDKLPSSFCCLSLLQLAARTEIKQLSAIEHDVGTVAQGRTFSACKLTAQQTSKIFRRSMSPIWNQGFIFPDSYPSIGALLEAPETQPSGDKAFVADDRISLEGSDVMLLVTLHDSNTSASSRASDDLLGKALFPVQVGHPADHWVVMRGRDGSQLPGVNGRNPMIHLRVAYGASTFQSVLGSEDEAGFWA
mmetsp:Transcript_24341/g.38267  ORF Transcript_24341/g.38267 Transcript_24341/m.38267 type:complete len:274 (+) Transcript_24341:1-822(+)